MNKFMNRIIVNVLALVAATTVWGQELKSSPPLAPATYGPIPTTRQLQWHEMEYYGFVHFTVNTFTDKEWGYGDESEKVFNPTDFNADQIARTAKAGGMKGLILTCKHHDGFCLWPSQYTEHSVKNSPWKNGKGDVVKEMSEACRKQGLKFGVYLSPWDRNRADYGTPAYITYYRNQLRELLTQYGEVFTVWLDGANGGDGFYGGAREVRKIDNRTYYDWTNTWSIVRELMPMACMFSDVGPDFRWVGNERGIAGETCWATINVGEAVAGNAKSINLNQGERPGANWLPPECDVSIRPGWFYHATEDNQVKTPAQLLDIYYQSVGRGAALNLNLPPDRRGRIHENDVRSLKEFRRLLDATFAKDLAKGAKLTASNVRGSGAKTFAAANVLDHDRNTYWATDDGVTTPELILEFKKPVRFNVISLREFLPLGQRVEAFAVDVWQAGGWQEFARGTSIGNLRLVRGGFVTTDKVRLRITQAPVCPAIAEFGLFAEPEMLEAPEITRDRKGLISISSSSPANAIRYTLDGTEPGLKSPLFEAPIELPTGGVVKARQFPATSGKSGAVATRTFGVSKAGWKIVSKNNDRMLRSNPANAIDDNPNSVWRCRFDGDGQTSFKVMDINLGQTMSLTGFTYQPPADGQADGIVDKYEFYVSADGVHWGTPAAAGEFSNIKANPIQQFVALSKPVTCRFIRFVPVHLVAGDQVAVAELGVTIK